MVREQRRTVLLERSLDSSLLRQKELQQLLQQQEHRLSEMAESQQFREQPQLLLLPSSLPQESQPTHLDLLLSKE